MNSAEHMEIFYALANLGSHDMKTRIVPEILSGEKPATLCITEPGAGSGVAGISTRAVHDGDDFIVNGCKTFITGGMNADYYVVAARTGDAGIGGISLLLVERDTPGFTRTRLEKNRLACLRYRDPVLR